MYVVIPDYRHTRFRMEERLRHAEQARRGDESRRAGLSRSHVTDPRTVGSEHRAGSGSAVGLVLPFPSRRSSEDEVWRAEAMLGATEGPVEKVSHGSA